MIQFKNKENGFTEIRNKMLVGSIPLTLVAAIVGLAMSELKPDNRGFTEIHEFLLMLPVILGAMGIGIYMGIKKQKTIYYTYLLSVDDEGITREQKNTPVIRILFSEIIKITKTNEGGLVITGKSVASPIIVPSQLEEIDKLEEILRRNCTLPFTLIKSWIRKLNLPVFLSVLALMFITYVSTNKILIFLSGLTLILLMGWSFFSIQKNKNIDRRTKRISYLIFIVMLSIGGILIVKVFDLG